MTKTNDRIPVLVTTDRRGVFFGYCTRADIPREAGGTITLANVRNCLRWRNTRGFLGLAGDGPNDQCRIGPPALELTLYGVTAVALCTGDAAAAWEKAPWAK